MKTRHVVFSLALLLALGTASAYAQRNLNNGTSNMFSGSGNCTMCHGAGTNANVTSTGEDVSPPSTWRSAMMGNAARDPFWQAVVRSESADLPAISGIVEDKCTNCHVPMGHEEARAVGDMEYTLDEAKADALAMDGVSCTLCHQIEPDNFGTVASFSGGYEIAEQRVTYGPYQNPLIQPMKNITRYEPVYAAHVDKSELCATCHTLFTPYVDATGQIAGEFPEQTPYLEWRASVYPGQDRQCQSCHMPALEEAIRISSMPIQAPQRSPYFQHHFVGGNSYMLGVIKAHADELGATAFDEHYDSSIVRTQTQLIESTVRLSGSASVEGSQLKIDVTVENLAGHKFPSGFPSRRAWLHVTVKDAQDRTVFESGGWNADGELLAGEGFHAHADRITDDSPQVYESVMENTDGEVTARLLRAAAYRKDNRLPPAGFTSAAVRNDTMGVKGAALSDADFNDIDGSGNTGGDVVHYAVPVNAADGPFTATVEMCYQSIKPIFIENLKRHDIPDVNRMVDYHDNSNGKVVVITQISLSSDVNSVDALPDAGSIAALESWPSPLSIARGTDAQLGWTLERPARAVSVELYTLLGRRVAAWQLGMQEAGHHGMRIPLHRLRAGMYMAVLRVDRERKAVPLTVLP